MHSPSISAAPRPLAPRRQLTLFDSVCVNVGIIVGAGIYQSSPLIAASVPSPGWLIGVWIAGGLISLLGALSYAELTVTYLLIKVAFLHSLGFEGMRASETVVADVVERVAPVGLGACT